MFAIRVAFGPLNASKPFVQKRNGIASKPKPAEEPFTKENEVGRTSAERCRTNELADHQPREAMAGVKGRERQVQVSRHRFVTDGCG